MTTPITELQIEAIKNAIQLVDGQKNLADGLALKTQGQISSWVTKRRPIPAKHCLKIELLTNGQVTRYDLRPDVFGLQTG